MSLPPEPQFGFWLPVTLAPRQWHCFASSRLGQQRAADSSLLVGLEQVTASLRGQDVALLYARGFALAAHLRAASQRSGVPLLELSELPLSPQRSWFCRQVRLAAESANLRLFYFLLPSLPLNSGVGLETGGEGFASEASVPAGSIAARFPAVGSPVDWLAIHLASVVHVFAVRAEGNVEASLRSRLRLNPELNLSVRLLEEPRLTSPALAADLHRAGALRWIIGRLDSATAERDGADLSLVSGPTAAPQTLEQWPDSSKYLYHWTRRAPLGRQRQADLPCLQLLGRVAAERWRRGGDRNRLGREGASVEPGPLRTLLEILTSGRILANGRWTVDGSPVVSLTAQLLERWQELRTFRAHLGRWDFEPFGIGLDRERVWNLDGRPVRYGDESLQHQLRPAELPWFQLKQTRGGTTPIDWTVEREWRVPGDIELKLFGPGEALVFVPDLETAKIVAPFSRWPVIAISVGGLKVCRDFF